MGQTALDRELIGRVRQHVDADLRTLLNYTCQETLERSYRSASGEIEFRERLRLEVLVTNTGESFAWPGSSEFPRVPLESWIRVGAIGTGNFGLNSGIYSWRPQHR
jgi:hypothetical protein